MNLSTALSKYFPKKSSLLDNGNCCTLVFESLLESVFPKITKHITIKSNLPS